MTRREELKLSRFLGSFPNRLESTATKSLPHRRIFWSHRTECDSPSDDGDVWVIHDKIKSAFCDVHANRLKGLIQFWAPEKSTPRRLSTSNQPFALEYLDGVFKKYRLCCMKYKYSIDDHVNDDNKRLEDPWIISNGPVATAFLYQFPEVVMDLRVHQGSPLVDKALDCGLTSLILLPVFYHQTSSASGSSSCIGVVECCMMVSGLHVIFNELRRALERVGLSTYHVQECLPYKTMHGLKQARDEIEEALKIVCKSYHLSLAQVWVPKESEKQKFVVKLCGYRVDDLHDADDIKTYCDSCDVLPMKMGEWLPGKILEDINISPLLLCKDLFKLRLKGFLGFNCRATKCSCVLISLRSIHTGDNVDYAFELLWPKNRNSVIMSKHLLSTLTMCLPSFKFAFDAPKELLIRDVDSLISSECEGFNSTIRGNIASQMPKPLEKEWRGPIFRKITRLSGCEDAQKDYFDDDFEYWGYDDDIPVVAEDYTGNQTRFQLRCSYMLENVKEEVEDRLNVKPETYKMEFESTMGERVDDLNTDDDLARCIKLWRNALRAGGEIILFKVRVLQKE